ncbi:hypothetical protein [Methylobacterium oryzihabitans]|uniref:Uncharacterized protein n=1 Tax=Methylobacterium oryzihabitans TaxID=2499852 RepID=A0A437NW09_9HYPH|nr:hypothetical protein [Methylobacterium oryzihabitans]RVU14211.1 hypothetical protein EOE48_24415 [Methylobacterium oryzihabitans]
MSTTAVSDQLRPYVPASFYDGANLKAGISVQQAESVAAGIQSRAGELPPAQAAIFLALVGAADLAPSGKIPDDLGKALDAYVAAAGSVKLGSLSEDSFGFLARAMIEQAADARKNALQDRLDARAAAKTELMSQAATLTEQSQTLKDGAEKSLDASIAFAVVSIVISAVSVGIGVGGMVKGAATEAGKALSGIAQGVGTIGSTFGQLGPGVSGYQSTDAQATAKGQEAQGAIDAAMAQEKQATADVKKEAQQALDEMVRSIINFLKELSDAKAQQMQSLTRV